MHPTRRCFHRFAIVVGTITGLAAAAMALGQFLGIAFQTVGPIQYVLRVYAIILCVLVILNELEWTKMTRESPVLRFWITRGLFYAFIGVLGLEENDTATQKNGGSQTATLSLAYIRAVAWIMVATGAFYALMGLCCLQIVYNRMRADYEQRVTRSADVRRAAEVYSDRANVAGGNTV